MSSGLANLKALARGLGDEIEDQNHMVDRITDKAEAVGFRVGKQNKEMSRIMGNKK